MQCLAKECQAEVNFAYFFACLSVSLSVCLYVCLPDLLATLKDPRRVSDQDKIACELWLGVQWLLVGADCEIVGLS